MAGPRPAPCRTCAAAARLSSCCCTPPAAASGPQQHGPPAADADSAAAQQRSDSHNRGGGVWREGGLLQLTLGTSTGCCTSAVVAFPPPPRARPAQVVSGPASRPALRHMYHTTAAGAAAVRACLSSSPLHACTHAWLVTAAAGGPLYPSEGSMGGSHGRWNGPAPPAGGSWPQAGVLAGLGSACDAMHPYHIHHSALPASPMGCCGCCCTAECTKASEGALRAPARPGP